MAVLTQHAGDTQQLHQGGAAIVPVAWQSLASVTHFDRSLSRTISNQLRDSRRGVPGFQELVLSLHELGARAQRQEPSQIVWPAIVHSVGKVSRRNLSSSSKTGVTL